MSVVISHENYCLESVGKQFMVVDDFLGRLLKDEWTEGGSAGGSTALQDGLDGGVVRFITGAVDGDYWRIYWNNIRSLSVSKRVCVEFRARVVQATYIGIYLASYYDDNNNIRFSVNETVGGATNWLAFCRSAGVETVIDTGVVLDTSWHTFRIETSSTSVKFYIDGTLVTTIVTNIPTSYLQSYIYLVTRTALARNLDVDYIVVKEDR